MIGTIFRRPVDAFKLAAAESRPGRLGASTLVLARANNLTRWRECNPVLTRGRVRRVGP